MPYGTYICDRFCCYRSFGVEMIDRLGTLFIAYWRLLRFNFPIEIGSIQKIPVGICTPATGVHRRRCRVPVLLRPFYEFMVFSPYIIFFLHEFYIFYNCYIYIYIYIFPSSS